MINANTTFFYYCTAPFVFSGLFYISISIIQSIKLKESYTKRLIIGMLLSAYIGYGFAISMV